MNLKNYSGSSLLERFPVLARLGNAYLCRRIPFIRQLTATECGAACLAMVLSYFGKRVRVSEIRDAWGVGRDGLSALDILNIGRRYGLRGRGVRLEVENLEYLEAPAILHWGFNHFVVFAGLQRGGVIILDPAKGRRVVPLEQFSRSFTGVTVLFHPAADFSKSAPLPAGSLLRYGRQMLEQGQRLSHILVTSLLMQGFALGIPALTGALVDRVVPRGDYHLLAVLGMGLLALVAFHFLAALIRAQLLLQLRTLLDARMTLGFCDHLVELPYAFFQQRSTGDLMMRLNSNTVVRETLSAGTLSGLLAGVLVVLYLLLILWIDASMAKIVLGLGLLQIAVLVFTQNKQHDLLTSELDEQSKAQSYQVEMLSGMETLKSTGNEQRAFEHWSDLFVNVLNASLARGRLSALVDALSSTLRMGSPLVILGFGTYQVLEGKFSLGTMLGLSALAGGLLGPLSNLMFTAGQLQLLRGYLQRLDDVLDTPSEQDRSKVRPVQTLRGQIELEEVSFNYTPMSPIVVNDVSLRIEPGQFVAIVGRSGSGKTSLANLLLGLYMPTRGRVLYDGVDLREMDLRSTRQQLGIVNQEPYLFSNTIRANITLSDPTLPIKAVEDAARLASIHDEIEAMPMRYETLLIDRGASLSGGQRQRVALARAFLRQPAILLLDEATSALDAMTESQVQDAISKLGCTRIVIAHRLSTVIQADLILVMEDGRVVEQGTHAQLLSRNGAYARLVGAQLNTNS